MAAGTIQTDFQSCTPPLVYISKTIPDNLKNQTLDFFVWKLQRNYAYIDNVTIVLIHEKLVE